MMFLFYSPTSFFKNFQSVRDFKNSKLQLSARQSFYRHTLAPNFIHFEGSHVFADSEPFAFSVIPLRHSDTLRFLEGAELRLVQSASGDTPSRASYSDTHVTSPTTTTSEPPGSQNGKAAGGRAKRTCKQGSIYSASKENT